MPTFLVSGVVAISVHTEVEAEDEKAAIKEASERGLQSFCHQCARSDGNDVEWRTSGELDGEVTDIRAEEID